MIRIFLGGVFFLAGLLKTTDLEAFAEVINAFAVLPETLGIIAATLLCITELILGIGLILDIKGSLGGIMSLLLLFICVLGYAIHMGYDIDCGCFGPEDPETRAFSSIRTTLIRDGFMLAMGFYLYWWRIKNAYTPRQLIKI